MCQVEVKVSWTPAIMQKNANIVNFHSVIQCYEGLFIQDISNFQTVLWYPHHESSFNYIIF